MSEQEHADEQAATLRILSGMEDVSAADWNSVANPGWLLGPGGCLTHDPAFESDYQLLESLSEREESVSEDTAFNPFISHEFLSSLEETGCATGETGWLPRHLLLQISAA